jgi:hypothetical protein
MVGFLLEKGSFLKSLEVLIKKHKEVE